MKNFALVIVCLGLLVGCGKSGDGESGGEGGTNALSTFCQENGPLSFQIKTQQNVSATQKIRGYINNALAFDECNANTPYRFERPTSINGDGYYYYYMFANSPDAFPYPQSNTSVLLRVEIANACGQTFMPVGSRDIPLTDQGGCYSASGTY